jgi:hypothetical protein
VGSKLQPKINLHKADRLTRNRANKLRAEVALPSMQADDSWLRYFESAFDKAAKVRMGFSFIFTARQKRLRPFDLSSRSLQFAGISC